MIDACGSFWLCKARVAYLAFVVLRAPWGAPCDGGGFREPLYSFTPCRSSERSTPSPSAILAMLTRVTLRRPVSIDA